MARPGYSKIYLVAVTAKVEGAGLHLVQAKSATQALAHIAGRLMKVESPSPQEIHELATKGVKLERAGEATS